MVTRSTNPARFGLLLASASLLLACSSGSGSTRQKRDPIDPGDDYFGDPPADEQGLSPIPNPDSGAFGASSRPRADGGSPADAGPTTDDGGVVGPKTYCSGALAAGDLAISEIMLASRAGSNDDGEWVEIRSTRTCWLKVKGVSVESPRGTLTNAITIDEDFELAPNGTFVVADSAAPAKNHALPGKVFAWAAADTLKNDGDTVTVKLGAAVIDAVTYPAFSNLVPGRTLAFPSDCPETVRSDWTRWSLTFTTWTPGFQGTPNAANDDVACY